MITLNIIGAGRLGKTLGYLWRQTGLYQIGSILNHTYPSGKRAVAFIQGGKAIEAINQLTPANITLIATPDDCIEHTCSLLAKQRALVKGSTVIHCSGSLTSDILHSARQIGCYVASVHPMASFNPSRTIHHYVGTYCAIEGDEIILNIVQRLFEDIGSIIYRINKTHKDLYHVAGVFASNYLVTLANEALKCLKSAYVPEDIAAGVVQQLMRDKINDLENNLSPSSVLTGPIQRGDITTIQRHLNALSAPMKHLYASLGLATLPMTELDRKTCDTLKTILTQVYHPES